MKALLADLRSGAKDQVDTIEHTSLGQERIIYTALRDADGAYRGVLQTGECEREMRAALVGDHGVDLVDDDGVDGAEHGARLLRGHQNE